MKRANLNEAEKPALSKGDVICRCPVCKSENIKDNSVRKNNGVIGHGFSSWKVNDTRCCLDCGVMFVPVKGNGR